MAIQIIGKGGFAREVACYIHEQVRMYEHECEGILDNIPTIIAIGDGATRKKVADQFPNLTYTSVMFGTEYDNNHYGHGTIICPGTILTTGITIGRHVIINLCVTIGHDCVIRSFVTISPGANISGNVTIGELCYIGTNAVIRDKVTICAGVTIGAGGVVVKDITEPGVYVGNPVKKIQ